MAECRSIATVYATLPSALGSPWRKSKTPWQTVLDGGKEALLLSSKHEVPNIREAEACNCQSSADTAVPDLQRMAERLAAAGKSSQASEMGEPKMS